MLANRAERISGKLDLDNVRKRKGLDTFSRAQTASSFQIAKLTLFALALSFQTREAPVKRKTSLYRIEAFGHAATGCEGHYPVTGYGFRRLPQTDNKRALSHAAAASLARSCPSFTGVSFT